jgi:tetratricopeptide (TPR) repeat protein
MRSTRWLSFLCLQSFIVAASAPPSIAKEEEMLVEVCGGKLAKGEKFEKYEIPGFATATTAESPPALYPGAALSDWSEGWVSFEFGIGADGAVRNIRAVDAVGSKDFVTSAMRVLAKRRYSPAMRNGTPVDQHFNEIEFTYLLEGSGREAYHEDFVNKYQRARGFIRRGKFDEAVEILEKALSERINLYEIAMGSFVLAVAHAKNENWPKALLHIRHAVLAKLKFLNKPMRAPALELQVELAARDGSLAEALCAHQKLGSIEPSSASLESPAGKIAARIRAALDSSAPLALDARLANNPLFDAPAVWRRGLLRRKFSFAEIKGEVRSFRLACQGAELEATVDAETRWDVPTNAGYCMLRVEGAPGATFRLIEEH